MSNVITARVFRVTDCVESALVEAATAADAFTAHFGIAPGAIRNAEQAGAYPAAAVADRDIDPDGGACWASVEFEPTSPTANPLVLEAALADDA